MKATELRINNYVSRDGAECIVKGLTDGIISVDVFVSAPGNMATSGALIIPIPITEDWLIRFGFTKYKLSCKLRVDDWCFEYSRAFDGIYSFILESNGYYEAPGELDLSQVCQYVHQLQNLYFALTGKELTLKETL